MKKISNMDYIKETLLDLTERIDMEVLGLSFYNAKPGEPPGVTGVVVITTSHISIHTFTDTNHFWMDVFSCKMFNPRTIQDYIKKKFGVKKIKINFQLR